MKTRTTIERTPRRCVAPLSLEEIDICTDSPRAREAMRVLTLEEIAAYRAQGADPTECDLAEEGESGRLSTPARVAAMRALRPVLCGEDAPEERTVEGVVMPLCAAHAAELDAERRGS